MSEPIAWYVRHSANEPPLLFTDEDRAKKAAFSCGCGAKPLYLSQVSPQENSTEAWQPNPSETPNSSAGDDFRIPPSSDPVHRMCDKALTQLGQQWQSKLDAAWGVKTPNDATPMAGSGPTVPAKDRASDCSEDGRVRASASSIGNTQEPVAWGVRRVCGGWKCIVDSEKQAEGLRRGCDKAENWAYEVVPLYRSPTLTDAEREAVEQAALRFDGLCQMYAKDRAATLRGLLERLGGER